jgi:DNA-binding MarR family transcriptional regulator
VPQTQREARTPALPTDPVAEAARLWAEHGWADAVDGMALVTSVMRAQQIFLSRVDGVLKPFEITFARYEVLMLLHFSRRGSLPMSLISSRLQVHPTSVTNAVDRLEDAHLVRRGPHPRDRRTTLVHLTEAGRDVVQNATAELNREVFTNPGVSAGGARAVIGGLGELREQAGDFVSSRPG